MEPESIIPWLPADAVASIMAAAEIYDLSSMARVCRLWSTVSQLPWVMDGMMAVTRHSAFAGYEWKGGILKGIWKYLLSSLYSSADVVANFWWA